MIPLFPPILPALIVDRHRLTTLPFFVPIEQTVSFSSQPALHLGLLRTDTYQRYHLPLDGLGLQHAPTHPRNRASQLIHHPWKVCVQALEDDRI